MRLTDPRNQEIRIIQSWHHNAELQNSNAISCVASVIRWQTVPALCSCTPFVPIDVHVRGEALEARHICKWLARLAGVVDDRLLQAKDLLQGDIC